MYKPKFDTKNAKDNLSKLTSNTETCLKKDFKEKLARSFEISSLHEKRYSSSSVGSDLEESKFITSNKMHSENDNDSFQFDEILNEISNTVGQKPRQKFINKDSLTEIVYKSHNSVINPEIEVYGDFTK